MRLWLLAVGRPGRLLARAVGEYERRAARYWRLRIVEVKAARAGKGTPEEAVRNEEAGRLLDRLPGEARVVALTREGEPWSSVELAGFLEDAAVGGAPGMAFVIGGAFGLGDQVLRRADHRMSLSAFTLPHDLARLVLAEQLYRAGTIRRGEPYHKG